MEEFTEAGLTLTSHSGGLFEAAELVCPLCAHPFSSEFAVGDRDEPTGEYLDFCPIGPGLAPFEADLTTCPSCGLSGTAELFGSEFTPQTRIAVRAVLDQASRGPQPWEAFSRLLAIADLVGYDLFSKALLCLHGAWCARAHEDMESEATFLSTLLACTEDTLEADLTPETVPLVLLWRAESFRRLGLFDLATSTLVQFAALADKGDDSQELEQRAALIASAVDEGDVEAKAVLLHSADKLGDSGQQEHDQERGQQGDPTDNQ